MQGRTTLSDQEKYVRFALSLSSALVVALNGQTQQVQCPLQFLRTAHIGRLLCLKNPYTYYGMQEIDKITISLMNITLDNAKGVALDKMNQMILSSE